MNKSDFVNKLKSKLSELPEQELEERLSFYSEMIDDRIEEGASEEEAVAEIGSVDNIAAQIIADIPLGKLVKSRIKPKRILKAWEIICLALGSPIWLSLGIALVAVIFSVYAALFAVLVALWAVELCLAVCSVAAILSGIIFIATSTSFTALSTLCIGLVGLGTTILVFFCCKKASQGIFKLTKNILFKIKKQFVNRENTK